MEAFIRSIAMQQERAKNMESYRAPSNERSAKAARRDAETEPRAAGLLDVLPEETLVKEIVKMDADMMNAFRLVCKKASRLMPTRDAFKKLILSRATKRILKRLERLPNGLGKILLGLLVNQSAMMAGGYVLQCITGDTYADSSINIFMPPMDHGCGMPQALVEEMGLAAEASRDMLESVFETKSPESPFYGQAIETLCRDQQLTNLENVFEIDAQSVKVQFLFVAESQDLEEPNDLSDYVEKHFDLDVCKCSFDGQRVQSTHLLAQLRRVATLRDPIVLSCLEVKKTCEEKYKKAMPKDLPYARVLEERTMVVEQRVQKYEGRGFKVLVDH